MKGEPYGGYLSKFATGIPLQRERRLKRREIEAEERFAKTASKKRDKHRCRWPGCDCGRLKLPLESAHVAAKGMGGDHGVRTTTGNLITLCRERHRGIESLHSGHLKIVPITKAGADGPCAFVRNGRTVARETAPGRI